MFRVKTSLAKQGNLERPVFRSMTAGSRAFCVSGKVKKGKSKKVWAAVVLAALCVAACQRPAARIALSGPTRQLVDDLGRTVTVPAKVTRVVSTAPSVTENVFAVGAGDRLVGVTTFCNYPEEAKTIAKVGDTLNPNMETIVNLKPDVVLVSSASQLENFTKVLADNGIAVYVTNPVTLDDVFQSLLRLGELFDTRGQAESMVTNLSNRVSLLSHLVSFVEPRGERKVLTKVFVQISNEPLFTVGRDSFLTDIIKRAYGESVTKEVLTAYPTLSKETASALNPDVIILSESSDNQQPNAAFRNSSAVRNGRVYKINADILSRPGPRLVDAMEQIARFLHPEEFRNN